jgi:hypothetical protein
MSEQIRSLPGNTSWSEGTLAIADGAALASLALGDAAAGVLPAGVPVVAVLGRALLLPLAAALGLVLDEPHAAATKMVASAIAPMERRGRM